jgi:hypothetical protein
LAGRVKHSNDLDAAVRAAVVGTDDVAQAGLKALLQQGESAGVLGLQADEMNAVAGHFWEETLDVLVRIVEAAAHSRTRALSPETETGRNEKEPDPAHGFIVSNVARVALSVLQSGHVVSANHGAASVDLVGVLFGS